MQPTHLTGPTKSALQPVARPYNINHDILLLHVQVPIAVMVLLDPQVHSDTIYGHTQLSVLMCVISSGYFLHDLIIVLMRLDTEGVAMLVHACCCLFVYTYAVYSFYLTFYGEKQGLQLHLLQEHQRVHDVTASSCGHRGHGSCGVQHEFDNDLC
jgi:hypothetical protein